MGSKDRRIVRGEADPILVAVVVALAEDSPERVLVDNVEEVLAGSAEAALVDTAAVVCNREEVPEVGSRLAEGIRNLAEAEDHRNCLAEGRMTLLIVLARQTL